MEEKLLEKDKKRKIWKTIFSVLACLVVFCTTYALILPAITMETKTFCGHEEHTHSDECYETELKCINMGEIITDAHEHSAECYQIEKELICGLDERAGHKHEESCSAEDGSLICGLEEAEGHSHSEACYKTKEILKCELKVEETTKEHIHTEECYSKKLACDKEEHTHKKICYSDPTADVETAKDWENTLPDELTTVWADDVLAVADSQLGYKESTRNYVVDENGKTRGYSRYGDWYGDSYGHWCAMFVSFCLNYAGIDEAYIPYDASCQNWIDTLSKEKYDLYREAEEYEPVPGDLIFFNWDQYSDSDHVGFVYEMIDATEEHGIQVKTIEGNASDTVKYRTYDIDDESIMGYGQLPKNPDEVVSEPIEEEEQEELNDENVQQGVEEQTEQEKEQEEGITEDAPIVKFSLRDASRALTGNWVNDILTVARSELNTESSKYINWYNEKYGASTQTWNSHEVMATFVSYCIVNAGIPEDVIPVGGNTNFDWVNALDEAGVYKDRTSEYFPKVGDIVLGSSSWAGRNRIDQVGIITEIGGLGDWGDGSYLKVIWANGGSVKEEQTLGNFKVAGNVAGFIEIPCGKSACTVEGVLSATATYAIGDVETGANLVVEIINGSEWEASVREDIQTYGYEIMNNHYLSVCFEKENESGEKVKITPAGPVDIEIEFLTPLSSGVSKNTTALTMNWESHLIDSKGDVRSTATEYGIRTNSVNGVTGLTFVYEDAQAIVLSSMQETYTTFETDIELGKVTAACKTLDIPEDAEVQMIVKMLSEEENNAAWTEALEAKYLKEGYAMPALKYFTIKFVDADGNEVDMPDNTEVEFVFDPELSAALENGLISEEGDWKLDSITVTDDGVAVEEIEATVDMTKECALNSMVFTYEKAQRYSLAAVVIDPSYAIEKAVSSYEELVAAVEAAGSTNTVITIAKDFEADGPITISDGKRVVIDLAGHTIQTADTLFVVEDAVFTIQDSGMNAETVSNIGAQSSGMSAEYNENNKVLTYYVTESEVTNKNTGETVETVSKHTVALTGAIVGGESPIVVVTNTEKAVFNLTSGALTGSSNRAIVQQGGTVNLKGGYICGNSTDTTSCMDNVTCWNGLVSGGAVYVTGSSTLNVTGTVLAANSATERGGAIAVESSNKAVINITGGIISGNQCTTTEGSEKHAINDYHLGGGGVFINGNATVNLNGGYITNNKVVASGYYDGGGGIYVKNGCSLNIAGTYVTGNYSQNSGGGILTSANTLMTGGYVNGNYAREAEGGGIAVNEPAIAYIYGGFINNNTTDTEEHWGGGGLFCANGSTLVMEHALITENYAGGYGGGVAGCSTGRVYLFVKEGAAIYHNMADGINLSGRDSTKNEDHSYVSSEMLKYGFEDYFCALNSVVDNYMLGGYPANWKGSVDGVAVEAKEGDTLVASYIMLLKSQPSSEGIAVAQSEAKIYINGNNSNTHGGGVLANGYMIVGEEAEVPVYSRIHLKGSKQLIGDETTQPELKEGQFEFVIKNADTDRVIATAKNDAEGVIDFNHLITFTEEGTFTYLVYENPEYGNTEDILMDTVTYRITIKVEKESLSDLASYYRRYQYKISNIKIEKKSIGEWELISEEKNPSYAEEYPLELKLSKETSFVNQKVATTKISVLKKWVGIDPPEGTVIRVQLYRDGIAQGEPVELSREGSWYYSWGELPLYETDASGNRKYYKYTVKEQGDTSGYQVEYETHNLTTRTKAWIPYEGELIEEREYIVVSGDGEHVLYLSNINGYYNLGEGDKQTIAKKTDTLTINGKEYETYCLDSEISEQSIYHANRDNREDTNLVFKYYGGAWGLLTAPNGTLKSSYDMSNLYVGDIYIGKGNTESTAYKIVYDGKQFTTVPRTQTHNNEAKIYSYVESDATTETIYAITNTKIPEEIFYKLDITKVNADDENILLEGAEFELIPAGEPEEGISFKKIVSGKYEYCNPDEEGATKKVVTSFGGKLVMDGIPAGEYILRETKAPNGYLPVEDQRIILGDSSNTTIRLKIADEKEKEEGFELPETGGTGTYPFVLGGCLLLAASLLGYSMRRRRKEVY